MWVARAERTINAVAAHLADDDVLRGRGGGDGGLFAGILARYLALAALRLPELGSAAGDARRELVLASAEAAWRNRALARGGPLFGPEWSQPAQVPRSAGHARSSGTCPCSCPAWMIWRRRRCWSGLDRFRRVSVVIVTGGGRGIGAAVAGWPPRADTPW